jgi:hypothetical protein
VTPDALRAWTGGLSASGRVRVQKLFPGRSPRGYWDYRALPVQTQKGAGTVVPAPRYLDAAVVADEPDDDDYQSSGVHCEIRNGDLSGSGELVHD